MRKIRRISNPRVARADREKLPLQVLIKFRLIINSTKRHFKWVEEQCGINGTQLWALWEVAQKPRLHVTELAAAMALHQSTVSILLNGLVGAKLIERTRSAEDQRVVELSISAAGRKLLARAPKPARGVLPDAIHRFPRDGLTALDGLLARVLKEMRVKDEQAMNMPLAEIWGRK